MSIPRGWRGWLVVVLIAIAGGGAAGSVAASREAAQATPVPGDPVQVVAAGLVNPRGVAFNDGGEIIVALAGTVGGTAGVAEIVAGCPRALVEGVPTSRVVFGAPVGVADVAFLNGQLYALVAGGDIDRGAAVNGLYRVEANGELALVADISSFIRDNPVAEVPGDYDTDGQPYALLPDGDGFLITEGNSNQLMRATLDGRATRVADLSRGHPIPTGIAPAPDGGVYVGYFSIAPYTEGTSKVVRVAVDGSVTDAWTGLSLIMALAVDGAGELYALEMASGYGDDGGEIGPGTGRLVRQTGPDGAEVVATGLSLPTAMEFGPDGALYVASPAFGADGGEGTVLRLDLTGELPLAVPAGLAAPSCG